MPSVKCTGYQFIEIIEAHGFTFHRKGRHPRYRGVVDGEVRFVDIGVHNLNEHLSPRNLASMIRQSGLPKRLFRM